MCLIFNVFLKNLQVNLKRKVTNWINIYTIYDKHHFFNLEGYNVGIKEIKEGGKEVEIKVLNIYIPPNLMI